MERVEQLRLIIAIFHRTRGSFGRFKFNFNPENGETLTYILQSELDSKKIEFQKPLNNPL